MTWRPISDAPKSRVTITALIAMRDHERDDFVLLGLCMYRGGRWLHDDTMLPVVFKGNQEYWWIAEEEVLQSLERIAAEAALEKAG